MSFSQFSICALCNNSFISKQKEVIKCAQANCQKNFCKNCIETIFNDKFKKCQTLSMQGLWICYSCRELQQENIIKPKKQQQIQSDFSNREINTNVNHSHQKAEKNKQSSSSVEKELFAIVANNQTYLTTPENESNLNYKHHNHKSNSSHNFNFQQQQQSTDNKAKLKKQKQIIKCKVKKNETDEFELNNDDNIFCLKQKKIYKQKKNKIQKLNSKKSKFIEDQQYFMNCQSVTGTPQQKKNMRMFCNLQSPLSFITNSDFENCDYVQNLNLESGFNDLKKQNEKFQQQKQKQSSYNQLELEEQESISTDISSSSTTAQQQEINNINNNGFFEILKFLVENSDSTNNNEQKKEKNQYDLTLNKISENLFNFGFIFHKRQINEESSSSYKTNNAISLLTNESSSQSLTY